MSYIVVSDSDGDLQIHGMFETRDEAEDALHDYEGDDEVIIIDTDE